GGEPMTDQNQPGLDKGSAPRKASPTSTEPRADTPWRTEGLPDEPEPPQRPKWWKWLLWGVALYFGMYLILSFQESLFAPPTIAYSEFTEQVANDNVESVYSQNFT